MNNMNANNSIKCSVSSCTHHNSAKSVCSLSSIQVGCCGPHHQGMRLHGMRFL